MTPQELRDSMHARINARVEKIQKHALRVHQQIDAGQIAGEEGRIWLEQFCVGEGVQLCAGDFAIGDSIGVDTELRSLGMDLWVYADRFHGDLPPLDYVVTNCLEYFPDTLRMLTEWGRMLKPGGVWACVTRNAAAYKDPVGPLANPRRASCFDTTTLCCYLERAGFEVFTHMITEKELRVAARRK